MIRLDTPRDAVRAAFGAGQAALVAASAPDDIRTPVAAMLAIGRDEPNAFLLESVEGGNFRGRYSVIGLEPDLIWRVREGRAEVAAGDDADRRRFTPDPRPPLESLRALIAASAAPLPLGAPPAAAGLFGYLGYETARFVEPRLVPPDADPIGAPEALLLRPTVVIVFDALRQTLTLFTPARPGVEPDPDVAYEAAHARLTAAAARLSAPAPAPILGGLGESADGAPEATIPHATYRAAVERSIDYIRAGDAFQIVPSQRFARPFELPPFALYRALRRLNPSPFLFYFQFDDMAVVGSSPEILVRVRDRRITLRPAAGTRPRGRDDAEDAALEADLLADPKERAEHLMLLDLGRNDVGRAAAAGTVEVTARFAIERYSHVMHIVSQVEGDLAADKDALDALFAGFPAGTVSGAPKVRAMEIIAELEGERRGVYAGAAGYFSAGGDMDMCIALRTGVVKDGVLHGRAGAGVVFDSDPETERLETVHKATALFRAAEVARRFV